MENKHFTVRLPDGTAKKFSEILKEHIKNNTCYVIKTRNSLITELVEEKYRRMNSKEKV